MVRIVFQLKPGTSLGHEAGPWLGLNGAGWSTCPELTMFLRLKPPVPVHRNFSSAGMGLPPLKCTVVDPKV